MSWNPSTKFSSAEFKLSTPLGTRWGKGLLQLLSNYRTTPPGGERSAAELFLGPQMSMETQSNHSKPCLRSIYGNRRDDIAGQSQHTHSEAPGTRRSGRWTATPFRWQRIKGIPPKRLVEESNRTAAHLKGRLMESFGMSVRRMAFGTCQTTSGSQNRKPHPVCYLL